MLAWRSCEEGARNDADENAVAEKAATRARASRGSRTAGDI
jgi:hypothetical protein